MARSPRDARRPRPIQQPALWSGRSRKPAVTGLATSPFGTGIPSRLPSTIRMAAGVGMIGCAFTNTSRKLMPPPGGVTPVLGNNPVAYGARWSLRHLRTRHGLHGRCGRAHCASQGTGRGDSVWVGASICAATTRAIPPRLSSRSLCFHSEDTRLSAWLWCTRSSPACWRRAPSRRRFEGLRSLRPAMNTSFSLLAIDITKFQPWPPSRQRWSR